MKKINNINDFFNSEVYYPLDQNGEKVWFTVYEEFRDKGGLIVTVKELAEYLLNNKNFLRDEGLISRIWKLYDCFDFDKYSVEASKGRKSKIFIRAGNKRSIAFAMRILNNIDHFRPITITDWKNYHYRLDTENEHGKVTKLEEIIC